MNINYIDKITSFDSLIILPFFEADSISFNKIQLSSEIFTGKKDTFYVFEQDYTIHLFVGLGTLPNYKTIKNNFRRITSKQSNYFKAKASIQFNDDFNLEQIEAAISGLVLGTYQLGHYKKTTSESILSNDFALQIAYKTDCKSAVERGIKIANAQLQTFNLVDLPPNKVTPKYLADFAIKMGATFNYSVTVFDRKKASEIGLNAFLSVGKGSSQEPQFIIMDYSPKGATKHIGLVGKGITFDTGGLNIKTAGMVHMKCDMAGGAAVIGAMQLIADLNLPHRVTAIIPACENSVDGNSFLPSDVIQSYAQHSIEIIDTDAEGRLILADGLSYLIKNYNPQTIIDVATLTGSSVATFGYECAALFTNNDLLANQLQERGEAIGERLWQLPLWEAYKSDIESEIADVKNYSGKPVAGAISAAKFLEFFTDNHPSWAHLDIAGVAFVDDEFAKTKHATAYGVHLITNFIENL